MKFKSEDTPIGAQTLVPGVEPITQADRLQWLAGQPMAPAKPQKPMDIGLFDEEGRKQLDLTDLIGRADG